MFRLSHFAAPAVLAAALAIGGCAAERHDDIPLTAAEVDEGRESVTYTAPYDGRVYVYDKTSGDMLYNGELRRGQMVRVDAKDNRILVDNQTAVERDLVNDHQFKIFFDRDENAETASQVVVPPSQTTVVTPPAAGTNIQVQPAQPVQPAPGTNIQVQPAQPAQPAGGTNIQVQPAQPAPAPSGPQSGTYTQPAQSAPRTTIQTGPDARTTVTTPDAKVTTDADTGNTTVQPR